MAQSSIIPAVLNFAASFPAENDAVRVDDDEVTWNKAWVLKLLFGDLAFASKRAQIGSPSGRAGGHIFIAGDLHRFDFILTLMDADDFIKMARVMANPLSR